MHAGCREVSFLIHPLSLRRGFFVFFHQNAPGLRKESVGPETEKRAPSAKRFKQEIWRLYAVFAVVALAVVYNEDQYSGNTDRSRVDQVPKNQFSEKSRGILPSQEEFNNLLSGSFAISDLRKEPKDIDPELNTPDQSEQALLVESTNPKQGTPISQNRENVPNSTFSNQITKIASQDSASDNEGEVVPITGYYCRQVPGYPVGDGGGYCGNTASGQPVKEGLAACGDRWKLETKLLIEGYKKVICLDRGHLGYEQVDVFFPTNQDLYETALPSEARVIEIKE